MDEGTIGRNASAMRENVSHILTKVIIIIIITFIIIIIITIIIIIIIITLSRQTRGEPPSPLQESWPATPPAHISLGCISQARPVIGGESEYWPLIGPE